VSSKSEQGDCHGTGKRHAETQGRKHDPMVAVRSQEVECCACGHKSQETEYHARLEVALPAGNRRPDIAVPLPS
jgi:hypothetical protein